MELRLLEELIERLEPHGKHLRSEPQASTFQSIFDAVDSVEKSSSGSWLGYHSKVYFRGFLPPPANALFSKEWGLMDRGYGPSQKSSPGWTLFSGAEVRAQIDGLAQQPDLAVIKWLSPIAFSTFEEAKSEAKTILLHLSESRPDDRILSDALRNLDALKTQSKSELIEKVAPHEAQTTRDAAAVSSGIQVPPHVSVWAETEALRQPFEACAELHKLLCRLVKHIQLLRAMNDSSSETTEGTRIFIGHGNSLIWRDLKEFLWEKLGLDWDEFKRISPAGYTHVDRLKQMLRDAKFAFLVLTAEDERTDGKMQARLNVAHEAGLFQAKLGFNRAILLLEDGCEEFSNVHGLGQIRFPKGKLLEKTEEIRDVLKREGVIS